MNRGRRDLEVALEVSLRRWTTGHFCVRIEKSEILTLQVREGRHPYLTPRRPTLGASAAEPRSMRFPSAVGPVLGVRFKGAELHGLRTRVVHEQHPVVAEEKKAVKVPERGLKGAEMRVRNL